MNTPARKNASEATAQRIEMILPSAFQAASNTSRAEPDGFVVGTITDLVKIHYNSTVLPPWKAPSFFDLVAVKLDRPLNDFSYAMAIIYVREDRAVSPLGHRLRGKLLFSDDQKIEIKNMASEYNDSYERQYEFMKNSGSAFFDPRTLHLAADDPSIEVGGCAVRPCLDMGLNVGNGESYYVGLRISCGAQEQYPGAPLAPKPILYNGTNYRNNTHEPA